MSEKITDVFAISFDDPAGAAALLGVAGVRSRTPLYTAEIRNLQRRRAYNAARGASVAAISNRLAVVQTQNTIIEAEVTTQRFFAEGGADKHAICGKVTVGGVGKEGLVVAAYDLAGKPVQPAVTTDASGAFVLVVEPPRPVRIVVSTKDRRVLHCDPSVYDFEGRSKYQADIRLDTAEPVPLDPEYPCDTDTGGEPGDEEPAVEIVVVPDLVGLTLEEASDKLITVGLAGDFDVKPDPKRDGVVIAQGVAAGNSVPRGTAIAVSVAELQLVKVPNVIGREGSTALATLREKGFDARLVTAVHDGDPGVVFDQFPEPGAEVRPSSSVAVILAAKQTAARTEVPEIVGLGLDEAVFRVREAGLKEGAVTEIFVPGGPDKVVVRQKPEAGSVVPVGSAVDIAIGRIEGVRRPVVPDLRGTRRQVVRALIDSDRTRVEIRIADEPGAQFRIIAQDPGAGATADPDVPVVLTVRPARTWKTSPQLGIAQLFPLSPAWLRSDAAENETTRLVTRIGQLPLDKLLALHADGPERLAEAIGLADGRLIQPFHAAISFAAELVVR